jgi:tetratricopeptide (TPR) repeat protein
MIFIVLAVVLIATGIVFADQKQDKEAILDEISIYSDKDPAILTGVIFSMADAYQRENKIDEAIALYEKALNIFPNDENILNRVANLYTQKTNYDKAIAVYKKLTDLKPENMWYFQMLSNSFNTAGKKEDAAGVWEGLVAKKGDDANVVTQAANFYSNSNDMEKAIVLAEKAVKLDANNVGYMQNLASFYNRAEKFDRAEETYKKIISMAKDQWLKDWANGEILSIYQRQNKLDELAGRLEAELAKNPNDVGLLKMLGELYARKGENDKTISMYEKIVSISPEDRNMNNRLIDLYESTGKFNEAAGQVEKLIKIAPNEPYLFERLANLYERAGRKEEARKAWDTVVSKVATDAGLYLRHGEVLYRWGDLNGALTQLKKAQEMDMRNLSYTLRSATMLIESGKIEEAKVVLGKLSVEAKDDWIKSEVKRRLDEIANMQAAALKETAVKPAVSEGPMPEPLVVEVKPGEKEEAAKVATPEKKKKRGWFGR